MAQSFMTEKNKATVYEEQFKLEYQNYEKHFFYY